MKFNIDKEKYIDSGLVTEREHPTFPLVIYNYTPECQFSKAWDEITLQCRGLIVHKETREIIARPFPKFFNYEEHIAFNMPIPNEIPNVYDKMDGSLGILYFWDNKPYIATRGSFDSIQARWANEWLKDKDWSNLNKDFTYLFEIIYPENRIVLSYDFSGLILLSIIHTETGETYTTYLFPHQVQLVKTYDFTSFEQLKALNLENKEGFVLHYPIADVRIKIKFEDYIKLHKIMTGLSQIGIWEMLKDGKNPFAQDIPDEMHSWLKGIVDDLTAKFLAIETEARQSCEIARLLPTRKEQALSINRHRYPSIAFSMLDHKNWQASIWKIIRPKGQSTFRVDSDN